MEARQMAKLTKRFVDSLEPDEHKDVVEWDDEIPGFGIRVKPTGRKTYILQYRNRGGRSRRLTIGLHGKLTPDQARRQARAMFGDVERGADPAEDKSDLKTAPTMADLCSRYLKDHAVKKKKARSIEQDKRYVERFILPSLRRRKVADVTRNDVSRMHDSLAETPYQANRVLALVSKMMNLAELWGYRSDGTNPCRHVEKFGETAREKYLKPTELAWLGEVLSEADRARSESPSIIAAIRLLLLTGCRLNEILELRWDCVDLENGYLHLPDSKTGSKTVHLNRAAQDVLASHERKPDNPFVIIGARHGSHLVNMQKAWRRIREKAGLQDVRLHDLRHSFASVAVGVGEGLPMIGKLLGHTQVQTTKRYAHLADDPVKKASEHIGNAIAGMMEGNGRTTGNTSDGENT
jgi:integrase